MLRTSIRFGVQTVFFWQQEISTLTLSINFLDVNSVNFHRKLLKE